MPKITEADLDAYRLLQHQARRHAQAQAQRDETADPLEVHTRIEGDTEIIEVGSDFAPLPEAPLNPLDRRGFFGRMLRMLTGRG